MGTQVSFSKTDHNIVLVTGNNIFKYHKLQDSDLKVVHQSLNKKEAHISNNYTCHCWLPEGKFLVCTDAGDIMLCDVNGEYKLLLLDSPGEGFHIETIRTYTKGFIIAGDKG